MTQTCTAAWATNERGVSLVELMVALVVVSIGILSVFQLFPIGMRSQSNDRVFSKGTHYAQQELERLSGLAYGDVDLAIGTHPPGSPESITGGFQRSYVVSALDEPLENMKKIDVTVTWSGGAKSTHAITYVRR